MRSNPRSSPKTSGQSKPCPAQPWWKSQGVQSHLLVWQVQRIPIPWLSRRPLSLPLTLIKPLNCCPGSGAPRGPCFVWLLKRPFQTAWLRLRLFQAKFRLQPKRNAKDFALCMTRKLPQGQDELLAQAFRYAPEMPGANDILLFIGGLPWIHPLCRNRSTRAS